MDLLASGDSETPMNARPPATVDGHASVETGAPHTKEGYIAPYPVPWHRQKKWRVFMLIAAIIVIGATVGGAVGGTVGSKKHNNNIVTRPPTLTLPSTTTTSFESSSSSSFNPSSSLNPSSSAITQPGGSVSPGSTQGVGSLVPAQNTGREGTSGTPPGVRPGATPVA